MTKLLICGRRPSSKSREQALTHLKTVHGPMVFAPPPDAGAMPRGYEQNHVFHPSEGTSGAWLADRDFVTEVWFDDLRHLAASVSTPYYHQHLQPDEERFVDQATVLKAVVREEGAWGTPVPDAAKLFLFLKRGAGIDTIGFDAARLKAADELRATSHPLAGIANIALPGPGGAEPYTDCVLEFWYADRASALSTIETTVLPALERLAAQLDVRHSFFLLADAYPVDRLRRVNGL